MFEPMTVSFIPQVRPWLAALTCLLAFSPPTTHAQVVISEIHYHPVEEAEFVGAATPPACSPATASYAPVLDLSEDVHEFIEIQNAGTTVIDLGGWTLSSGVDFTFPAGTSIAAGGFKVVAKNAARLQTVYAISGVLGNYAGGLSNRGETIRLKNAAGLTVDEASYSADFPWAQSANALGVNDRFTGLNSMSYQYKGRSLQRVSATGGSSDPANWLASPLPAGPSPGAAQAVTRAVPKPVVIAKSHAQTSDGSPIILTNQGVTVTCAFSSSASLSAVQLEWFVDDANATTEAHTTTAMTETAPGSGQYSATIAGMAARSVVRYRILANRGSGSEIVSPSADDPVIAAVGASNAVEPWHGYFVSPTTRAAGTLNYDLILSSDNLTRITWNATANPRRTTSAGGSGKPRATPWVPATEQQWNGTVPAVFAHQGVLYDVHLRFHGSRYHREGNANNLSSFKVHFPDSQPFQGQTSWFITSHGPEFEEGSQLNRLLGLPSSRIRNVTWYLNANASKAMLEQGEFSEELLDEYHQLRVDAKTDAILEPNGELYKDVGNRDETAEVKEGPYAPGDMVAIEPVTPWKSKYQRYEWTYALQNHAWVGPKPFADMLEGMWAARGDTPAGPSFSTNPTRLAATKSWFNSNFDMETTLTSMALVEWMSVFDDGKQNQFYWHRANGKWVRLGWDYDGIMNTNASGAGSSTQTIWSGEQDAPLVFERDPNWWKDTFYKCFREEYKQRLWQLNNSFFDPENLLAMGFKTTDHCYIFALQRQANVNTQLGLGTYDKPDRPSNTVPAANGTAAPGTSLSASAYSHPNGTAHAATTWQIRSATGNYEAPLFSVTSTTELAAIQIPPSLLTFGQTYYWHAIHTDADRHASITSAETRFTWSSAAPVTSDLTLNEILADNRLIKNALGATPDYLELHNHGTTAFDLAGLTLSDNLALPAKFIFPADTPPLAAGAYLRVWCDSAITTDGLHTGFGLSAGGQTVLLLNGATVLDSITFGPQAPDLAIGRSPNGIGPWTATHPTPAAANTVATLATTTTGLRINEWMADPAYGSDWFELHHSGSAPVALAGLYLSDTPGFPTITKIPPLSFIGAGGYTKFEANGTATGGASCNFKLSATADSIVLTAADGGTKLDSVTFSAQMLDVSRGRLPDGAASIVSFPTTASPAQGNWLEASVVVNEALAHPATGITDWIELLNPGTTAVDVSGWWLSDDIRSPRKYRMPAGQILPAHGFLVVSTTDFSTG
ncbi:MAG: hypothetical protein RLZZ522_1083, partial [Verrucomicrobiota bacterium]